MQIRKAVVTDNIAAQDLVRKSLTAFDVTADFEGLDAAIGALDTVGSPNTIELVADFDGVLAGCLAIQRRIGTAAKLFGSHVNAHMQGRGLGRALLSAAIKEGVNHG